MAPREDILAPFKKVKLSDLVVFSRQLATLINAGLPIVRSLHILSEQTGNQQLKNVVVQVRKDVEAGLLSEALEKHPEVFSRLYVEMVKAGEIGGMLDSVLLRVADQLERDQELRRKVRTAMLYPTFVLAFAILTASIMLIFIVPVFAGLFEDLGGTLPLMTRIVMGISDILTSFWGVLVYAAMGAAVFAFFVGRRRRTAGGCGDASPSRYRPRSGDGPEGSPRPLRPHSWHPERRWRTDPAGDRDNGHLLW